MFNSNYISRKKINPNMNILIISYGFLLLADSVLTESASRFEGFRELNPFYNTYLSFFFKAISFFLLVYYRKDLKDSYLILLNILPFIIVLNNVINLAKVL